MFELHVLHIPLGCSSSSWGGDRGQGFGGALRCERADTQGMSQDWYEHHAFPTVSIP